MRWMAPELLAAGGITSKTADIYALGMTAFEVRARHDNPMGYDTHLHKLFAEVAPFADKPPSTVAVEVLSGKRPDRPIHPGLTDKLWDLVQRCWEQEPLRRPEISKVVSLLERPPILRQDSADVVDIRAEVGAVSGSIQRESPLVVSGIFSYTRSFRLTRSGDQRHTTSRSTLGCFHNIEFNGSETSLQAMRVGELEEPAPHGLCGLSGGAAFWKPSRGTPSAQDCHSHRDIMSDKV